MTLPGNAALRIVPVVRTVSVLRTKPGLLKALENPVDTDRMNAAEATISTFEKDCLAVLGCYAVRDAAAKAAQQDYSGWLDRVLDVPGVETSSLTSIHGYLIAQGLIRFEFTGRSVGLQYQLSPQGRDCLTRQTLMIADDHRAGEVSDADSRSQAA